MQFTHIIQKPLEWAWWIEIVTQEPHCIYYFGPFASAKKAEVAQAGHIEDLAQEQAQGITSQIKWCKPSALTIYEDQLAQISE